MKRILIWLTMPLWLPVFLIFRLFDIGGLTREQKRILAILHKMYDTRF